MTQAGSVRSLLLLLLLVLAAAGGAAAGFAWRERETRLELATLEHARAVRDRLALDRERLTTENAALEQRVRSLEAELELERGGRMEAAQGVKRLQGELAGVREQLNFYQTIVPGGDALDMTVQEFRVRRAAESAAESADTFSFRAVLTRTSGRQVSSRGTFRLAVSGQRDGKRVRLRHRELGVVGDSGTNGEGGKDGIGFKIQHFSRVAGRFELPEGVTPERIVLEILLRGDQAGRMQRTYSWERATGE